MDYQAIHLVFFLSRATPLRRWHERGILSREIAIYQRLAARVGSVSLVTSGGEEELHYQEMIGKINILYNRWGLSPNFYSLLAPILHWSILRKATLYKTNQPDGAWTAIIGAKLYRKPVIARAGYLWAELNRHQKGHSFKSTLIDQLQAFSFRQANRVCLTSLQMKEQVAATYALPADKITVIPNYVDTERFAPQSNGCKISGRICFVGRLDPIKNLDMLIRAVAVIPGASLAIIGEGPQRAELEQLASEVNASVDFLGIVPNQQLPTVINRAEIFALPSSTEGHPKALLEAMACQVAVVGTDVPGIREQIVHGETGLLCNCEENSLREAIQQLLDDGALRQILGQNARCYILEHFALDKIVNQELELLRQLADEA